MADLEQGTTEIPKAPDAKDAAAGESVFPGDTRAQSGQSMGEHCATQPPLTPGSSPTGEISRINDTAVYISKPADYPHRPSKLLLFLTDAWGITSEHNKLQADHYAREGFVVVMPDILAGDPLNNNTTLDESSADISIIERIKLAGAMAIKSFMIDMWLARHTAEKTLPIIYSLLEPIRNEFADAVASGGGLYAVGYCFGGKYVALLAGEHGDDALHGQTSTGADAEEGMIKKGPFIVRGAFAHGTLVTAEDLEAVKIPLCIVAVENDNLFPDEIREAGKKSLESRGIEHEIEVYPGVPHGFARTRGYSSDHISNSQQRAFKQMVAWLQSH